MRNHGRPATQLLLAAFFGLLAEAAGACSCAALPDNIRDAVPVAYNRADVVFTGTAQDVRRRLLRVPQQTVTRFRTDVVWKGEVGEQVFVRSNIGELACGFDFDEGTAYLVFAYWTRNREQLITYMCDLTRREASAADAIKELRKLAVPKAPPPEKEVREKE